MRRSLPLLLAAVLATGAAACSSDEPGPAPSATASPSPTPVAGPVEGNAKVEIVSIAPSGVVPGGGGGVNVPEVARRPSRSFAGAVTGWLDGHLTSLQEGSARGSLQATGLLRGAARPARAAVTSALATPDRLVAKATYRIRVAALGQPRWAQARVIVTDVDGNRHTADFLFEPGKRGPKLIAAGPADRTATPDPTATSGGDGTPDDDSADDDSAAGGQS